MWNLRECTEKLRTENKVLHLKTIVSFSHILESGLVREHFTIEFTYMYSMD